MEQCDFSFFGSRSRGDQVLMIVPLKFHSYRPNSFGDVVIMLMADDR